MCLVSFAMAPEAVWQVWRLLYQSAEIWAVDFQKEKSLKLLPPDVRFED